METAAAIRRRAQEIIAGAPHPLLPLSEVRRPPPGGYQTFVYRVATPIPHAIAILDLVWDRHGHLRLIEANGSNAGATSFASDRGDAPRVEHFLESFWRTLTTSKRGVVLVGYAPGTGLLGEIVERAAGIAEGLVGATSVALRDAGETPGGECITVVCDSVPRVAGNVTRSGDGLFYSGIPIRAISNANLLPELARLGLTRSAATHSGYDVVPPIHDGPLCWLTHDRTMQQTIAAGTGLTPQTVSEARTVAEAERFLNRLNAEQDVFGKINGASGGTGVEFIRRGAPRPTVRRAIAKMIASATGVHGANAGTTIWPMRFFEATFSTGYELDGNEHVWDMRFLCLVRPDRIEVRPADMRLCPRPFEASALTRDMVVANTTGREPTVAFMRCPLAWHRTGAHLEMHHAGVDGSTMTKMCAAAALWCEKAVRERVSPTGNDGEVSG